MEILRFTLSGQNGFFKKPEVNTYCYFTYGNIHKVALLGIFGAILGYGGYHQMQPLIPERKKREGLKESYPEFYERLKNLRISVLPCCQRGLIEKKIQTFNNSVGYASKEQGGNLIVREQWLDHPKWEICVLVDCEEARRLKEALMKKRCVYYPYLGKNDHPADISEVRVETAETIPFEMGRLDSFVLKDSVEIPDLDEEEMEELGAEWEFKYEEALPYRMNGWTNLYELRKFLYTDSFLETTGEVYCLKDGKKVMFY